MASRRRPPFRLVQTRVRGQLPIGLAFEEDVPAVLPEAVRVHAVGVPEHGEAVPQGGLELLPGPDVVLPLLAFAVGVQRAVEDAFRRGEFALHEGGGLLHHAPVQGIAGGLVGLGIELQELGVVIEHLLEVGRLPQAVGGIAGEAAAQLIVDAAHGHLVQGEPHLAQQRLVAGGQGIAEQEAPVAGQGELRGPVHAALAAVEEGLPGLHHGLGSQATRAAAVRPSAAASRRSLPRTPFLSCPACLITLGDRFSRGPPGCAARPSIGRAGIGAAVDGPSVGQGETVEGPAPVTADELHGVHVHLVHIGPLLAIHLDADEGSFMRAAMPSFSKDSRSITWHQWQAE